MTAVAERDHTHPVTVRLANGAKITGPLTPERQAKLYGLVVHGDQLGIVEAVRATRQEGGKRLAFPHRPRNEGDLWLPADNHDALAKFVSEFRDNYELFVTPATFGTMVPGAHGVSGSQVAWIDQDEPDKVDILRRFPFRPHMVVATGGSGGVHAYWRLSYPVTRDEIGVINRKLVARMEGDRAAHNPARILRIPGSRNMKAVTAAGADGNCRIIYADLWRPPYEPDELVDGLTDYKQPPKLREETQYPNGPIDLTGSAGWIQQTVEIAEGSAPTDYYYRLTGHLVRTRGGHVCCPFVDHEDRNPSTHIYGDVGGGWFCFSCHRGGGPFHLAAALNGWKGGQLTGDEFKEAAAALAAVYGIERKD